MLGKRGKASLGLLIVGAVVAAGCGDDGDDTAVDGGSGSTASDGNPEQATEAAEPAVDESAFPVTMEHRFGQTEIAEAPERIVTVGLTDHDTLLALGIAPVGVTEWYGDHPHAAWPWAQDELAALGAEPEVVGNSESVNFENIAAQQPDLILALYAGLTQDDYDVLSEIAPVVAAPEEYPDFGIPWEEQTRLIGQAVGLSEQAEELVAGIDQQIADIAAEHPEFEGATTALASLYDGPWVYDPDIAMIGLLEELGFEVPDEIGEISEDDFGANLSMEQIDVLDVDALIWLDAPAGEGPLAEDLYTSLAVSTEGREVHLSANDAISGASFISPLSIPEILDQLVPMLEAAVDGDPGTDVPPVS